MGDIISGVG